MATVEIKRDWLKRARDRAVLEPAERQRISEFLDPQTKMHSFEIELSEWPIALWRALLDEANLLPKIRSAVALHVFGMRQTDLQLDTIYDTVVENPVEFGTTFQIAGTQAPNCEVQFNGRWYPVILTVGYVEDDQKWTRGVQIDCTLTLGERTFGIHRYISRDLFLDDSSHPRARTVAQVLEQFGYRRLQTSVGEYNLRLVKAERAAAEHGQVVLVTGSVIIASTFAWWRGFETRALGTSEMPARCVVEPALEADEEERARYARYASIGDESQSRLPFVRLFSLESKAYVFADVDDILPYDFDTDALSRLHLPHDMHAILQRVFDTPIEKMFGDLLKGKHGGVVILASGEPGVGKTLTAEIYAETTERPLYVLELGELGTNPSEVESRLQQVFARVTRWNAVLQFDECEIFLAKRGTDLERSAIVGIFLRLLDYYRGLLFLTTNKPEILDEAVLSRVMLRLEYPHLTPETRVKIWKTMFSMAELAVDGSSLEKAAQLDLNGRQIRNITRLTKILNPDGGVSDASLREAVRFGSGVTLAD